MLTCQLSIFCGRVSVKVFLKVFALSLLSVGCSLCILENSPFSDVSFANTSSQSVAFLRIHLTLLL